MTLKHLALRRAAITTCVVAVSGCLAGNQAPPPRLPEPLFEPTVFFAGSTHGEGTLKVRGGSARGLRVEGTGSSEPDGTFRLNQVITYGDGAVDTRVWRMRRAGRGQYTATLSDAKGDVTAESSGNLFHLRYLLRRPAVYMEQWLYLAPDGRSVWNLAQVTVLGLPWARLEETITRTDNPAR